MPHQYGEMFQRLGVPKMGRIGSGWCGIDPNGVLVLMSHQNFYHRKDGAWYYDAPGDERLPTIASPAAKSIQMIAEYFRKGREIILPIGVFEFDGCIHPDGTHEPAKFRHATGAVYRATMREFDKSTGRIVCDVIDKFEI